MMKVVLVACLVAAVLQVEASVAPYRFTDNESACIKELNLNEATISGLYSYGTIVEDNSDINELFYCVWRKLEFANEDGAINYNKIKESYPVLALRIADDQPSHRQQYDILEDAVNACENNPVKGSNAGEITTKTHNCIINNYYKYKFNAAN